MASKSTYTARGGDKKHLVRWVDPTTHKHHGRSFARSKHADDTFRLEVERKAQLGPR